MSDTTARLHLLPHPSFTQEHIYQVFTRCVQYWHWDFTTGICGRPCALRLEARMSFCLGVSFEGAFCTVLWFALQFSSTLNKCEEASLTFNKRGFSFFPNQLSPFSHSSQSSDAIPQSGPWQWAAYRAGHKQNINGVWAGLSYATPHLSFPKCELLEGNWPSP